MPTTSRCTPQEVASGQATHLADPSRLHLTRTFAKKAVVAAPGTDGPPVHSRGRQRRRPQSSTPARDTLRPPAAMVTQPRHQAPHRPQRASSPQPTRAAIGGPWSARCPDSPGAAQSAVILGPLSGLEQVTCSVFRLWASGVRNTASRTVCCGRGQRLCASLGTPACSLPFVSCDRYI